MKIRNEGTNPIIFNGGVAPCKRTIEVDDKIGEALVKAYSFIINISAEAKTGAEAPSSKGSDNELSKLYEEAKSLNIKSYWLIKDAAKLREKIDAAKVSADKDPSAEAKN